MANHHSSSRDRMMVISKYLWAHTDENHYVRLRDILAELEEQGCPAERKSVYRDMQNLSKHGFPVAFCPGDTKGWHITGKPFSQVDLTVLVDAVGAYTNISGDTKRGLISKISAMALEDNRRLLDRPVRVPSQNKPDTYWRTLSNVFAAIRGRNRIAFRQEDEPESGYKKARPRSVHFVDGDYILYAEGSDGEPQRIDINVMRHTFVIREVKRNG